MINWDSSKLIATVTPDVRQYLFPKGMSVMMISTELLLMGRLHKSH